MVVKHSSWLIILFLNYFPVFQDEQVPKFVQISPERYTNLTESEEQVKILCDKVNVLNEKLSAAQSDITTKDSLVKQHVKVAEEAVSGLKLIAAILYFFFLFDRLLSKLYCIMISPQDLELGHFYYIP